MVPKDVKVRLTANCDRDEAGTLTWHYRWIGTDGNHYSPAMSDYFEALEWPKKNELTPQ